MKLRRGDLPLPEEVQLYEHFFDTFLSLKNLAILLNGLGEERPAALELTIYKYMLLEITKLFGRNRNRSIVQHLLAGSSWADEPEIATMIAALTKLWEQHDREEDDSLGHTVFTLRDRYIAHKDFRDKVHPSDYVLVIADQFNDEIPELVRTVLAGLWKLYERMDDVLYMLRCATAFDCDVIDLVRRQVVRVDNFPEPVETDPDGQVSRATIERVRLGDLAELWREIARASGLPPKLDPAKNPWRFLDPAAGIKRTVPLGTPPSTDVSAEGATP